MSETRSLSLRGLIEKWRGITGFAVLNQDYKDGALYAFKICADQLDDALRAQEPPPCDHVYERQVCEQCAKCGDLRGCIQPAQEPPQIECPLCGVVVKQVSSATLDLALWQHVNWTHCRSQEPPQAQFCEWKSTDWDGEVWDSDCGQMWQFEEGGPTENHVTFCHGCGKRVRVNAACHRCMGEGAYERGGNDIESDPGEEVTCETCNGTGRLVGDTPVSAERST